MKKLIKFKNINWALIVPIILLAFIGLAAIYSVALGRGAGEFLNFQKQLVWVIVGFAVMIMFANLDYHLWQKVGWIGYFISLLLLALVLTPLGSVIRGSRGWFDLGAFSFQPVELMKLFIIFVLADFYSRHCRNFSKWYQILFSGFVVFLPIVLVLIQPDFGSAMVLFAMWFISLILVAKKKWHIVMVILLIAIFLAGSWFFVFKDYQKDRILTFLDPSYDPLGRGYNVSQSLIAVGAGRVFGRGLGFGSQSQLKFIPESQTDFIFAVVAEELGLFGVSLLLMLFAIVFYRLAKSAISASDDFGMFICLLVLVLLLIHVIINVGMGVGLLPVTGISLPFVSYGGSFLLILLILIGITINIYHYGNLSKNTNG